MVQILVLVQVLVEFLGQSGGRGGHFPAISGLGSHCRFSQWLGGRRGAGHCAVIAVAVGSGFELLGPGGGGRPVPALGGREKGEVWLGSGPGRT